jgi:hypothetical protein
MTWRVSLRLDVYETSGYIKVFIDWLLLILFVVSL